MCPKVQVKLLLLVRDRIGKDNIYIESDTVRSLEEKLIEKFSDKLLEDNTFVNENTNLLHDWMLVLVNGRNIKFLEGLDTKLSEGDVVVICPPVAGG